MNKENQKIIFSKNLNYYMTLHKKTQKEVAKYLGIPLTTFNCWCTGENYPRINNIQKLADYFGINKSDLIEEHNEFENNTDELTEYVKKNNFTSDEIKKIMEYGDFLKSKK